MQCKIEAVYIVIQMCSDDVNLAKRQLDQHDQSEEQLDQEDQDNSSSSNRKQEQEKDITAGDNVHLNEEEQP